MKPPAFSYVAARTVDEAVQQLGKHGDGARSSEEYLKIGNFREALVQAFVKIPRALIVSNGGLILGCWALAPIPLYVGYVGFGMGLVLFLCFVFSRIISPILWSWFAERTVIGGAVRVSDEVPVEMPRRVARH